MRKLVVVVLALTVALVPLTPSAGAEGRRVPLPDVAATTRDLPPAERWLRHMQEDLLPFWDNPTALGTPIGNFPTYRCNDGTLPDPAALCIELKDAFIDRNYTRMQGRQTYAYGVAYHLTGDEKYLDYARAGVDYLRANLLDRQNGGAYTYRKGREKTPLPMPAQRTSQDLAYALVGISFYFYLTRDPALLPDILELKQYIFRNRYDPQIDVVTWVAEDYGDCANEHRVDCDRSDQRQLVANLDQIYGYMLLLAPILPEPHRSEWTRDLNHLARIMIAQFYSPARNLFWGNITDTEQRNLGLDNNTDFGHTVKTLWMIHQIGKLTGDVELMTFGAERAAEVFESAYIPGNGSWAKGYDARGRIDKTKSWWISAELDQAAATLALLDPVYARYLHGTYNYWLTRFVDQKNKEVWTEIQSFCDDLERPECDWPDYTNSKQGKWKNAFHSFEHVMVVYLTTRALQDQDVKLYYAFARQPAGEVIRPYFYAAKVVSMRRIGATKTYEATFRNLR